MYLSIHKHACTIKNGVMLAHIPELSVIPHEIQVEPKVFFFHDPSKQLVEGAVAYLQKVFLL